MRRALRHVIRRIAGDRGFALPLALATTVVLAISVTATITYTSSESRAASVSKSRNQAYHLAEAGINNAMNVVNTSQYPMLPTLLPSTTATYDAGTVTWSGTLDESDPNVSCPGHLACWNITATG